MVVQKKTPRKVRVETAPGEVDSFTTFQSEFQFIDFLSFDYEGIPVGALLLKRGENAYQVKFCFDCVGIPPIMRSEVIDSTFDRFQTGCMDIFEGETLTFHHSCFRTDRNRVQDLDALSRGTDNLVLKLIIRSDQKRIQELTAQGVRKQRRLRLWCTYTLDPEGKSNPDVVEKILSFVFKALKTHTGEQTQNQKQLLVDFIDLAYREGFLGWRQLLENKMGLECSPLSVDQIWVELWERFNRTNPPPVPHYLLCQPHCEPQPFQHEDDLATGLLLESPSSVPTTDRGWVYVNGKYIGLLTLGKRPAGWVSKEAQLRWLWDTIADERVYDTEYFVQLSRGNARLMQDKLMSLTKQANNSAAEAAQKGGINVLAQVNVEKAVEAQAAIYEGELPIKTAVVVAIYRDDLERLERACSYFGSLISAPAALEREVECTWITWLQTIPLRWEKLLFRPFERYKNFLTSEVPGVVPIVTTPTLDRSGVEFISTEGQSPIYLDLFNQHRNILVFGQTRSGKSVFVSGIFAPALAQGIPITAMDYPKPDGSGTFRDLTHFLGGAYIDISTEYFNPFETPRLRGFDRELAAERMADYTDALLELLVTMVIGTKGGTLDPYIVRTLLSKALSAFFADPDICRRYALANGGGFGSPAWENYPLLKDFVPFCNTSRVGMLSPTPADLQAFASIRNLLEGWLSPTSRLGRMMSRPSSFASENPLLVVALRNLASDDDACILMMIVNNLILARALSYPKSIVFIDEAPILFEFPSIAQQIGRFCANGAKAGIRVILSAQEPSSILRSAAAPKIFANVTCRLIGKIQSSAVKAFGELNLPLDLVTRCAAANFGVNRSQLYSNWLIDDGSPAVRFGRSYTPPALLAAVANNPDEQEMRDRFLGEANDTLKGLVLYSQHLISA